VTTGAPTLELPRRLRRRAALGGLLLAGLAVVVLVVANPFSSSPSSSGTIDNGSPTSLTTIARRSLSSQTQVSATLGYADPGTIVQPSGTAPENVAQSQQTAESDRAQLASAQASLADDSTALARARAQLAADRQKASVDCAGVGATSSACTADAQALTTDEQSVTAAAPKVAGDTRAVASARSALAAADAALATARADQTFAAQSSIFTSLPAVGDVIRPGSTLYEIDGNPVVLLRGSVTAWRAFVGGMSPGADVAELNADLGVSGDAFTAETASAIRSFQRAHGLPETGGLLLGSVVFEPGAVRVTSVTPTRGAAVQGGTVLGVTSTRRQVTIALDASQQASVQVGDPVTITLPDQSTTPGRVSFVGSVATQPSSQDQGQAPTIEVDVVPTHPAATGSLDQAPVSVSITTATARDALVVPVTALLALAGGGYAVEEVGANGTHALVRIELGLFDDAAGLVQVTGSGLAAGQRIVVPAQ